MGKLRVGGKIAQKSQELCDHIRYRRELLKEERLLRPRVRDWYAGRSVFITGASGYVGRVLLEFLLRCCPDIGLIYVLLRPKKAKKPSERLQEMFDVPLFDRLRAEQPNALSKVVAISGDLEQESLGLSEEDEHRLCAEVSVIFHVAASVRFDDSFKKAVFINLRSTRDVVQLARNMPNLKLLGHVSTAYCCINQDPIGEEVYPSPLSWRDALRWAEELPESDEFPIDALGSKLRSFQPNTYVLTKGLAEELIEEASNDLPVVILRPSIVVGSLADPIPGWTDNLNGLGGFFLGAIVGIVRTVREPESTQFDTVPVDIVAKIIILASWAKGLGQKISSSPTVDVVNVIVGENLGTTYSEFSWMIDELKEETKFAGCIREPYFKVSTCPFTYGLETFYNQYLFGFYLDLLSKAVGVKPMIVATYRKMVVALAATAPFRKKFKFTMQHIVDLQIMTHPQDEKDFDVIPAILIRANEASMRKVASDLVRGTISFMESKGNYESADKQKYLSRIKWMVRLYHTMFILLGLAFLRFFFYRAFGV